MNYADIKTVDVQDGNGVRVSLYVSGCHCHCKGCHNQEAWDFNYGDEFDKAAEEKILDALSEDFITGFTVLGGEPFEKENQPEVLKLVQRVKKEFPKKSVWIYSGFTLEELLHGSRASGETANEILKSADVLVDGRFDKTKKNITLKFRGSENQRIIDLEPTLLQKKVVLKDI